MKLPNLLPKELWMWLLPSHSKAIKLYKMRAFLLAIVFSFVAMPQSYAQLEGGIDDFFYVDPKDDLPTQLGLRLGIGLNTIGTDFFNSPVPLVKFTGAVYNRYVFKNANKKETKWSIYNELGASFKGTRFNTTDANDIERLALIYLDLPIGMEYKIREAKRDEGIYKYRIFLGFQPSVLLKSSMFRSNDIIATYTDLPLQRMDYSAVVGVPIEIPIGFNKISISTYLKIGLFNINRDLYSLRTITDLNGNVITHKNILQGSYMNNSQLSVNIAF